jgi:hypothetical protein
MKRPLSFISILAVALLASSCGSLTVTSRIDVSSSLRKDNVVASGDLKKFRGRSDLKVVLRVPHGSGSITAGSLNKNTLIIESQLNNKGVTVLDRGEMTSTLGESNESFAAIKQRTGADLILEVVKFSYEADLYEIFYNKAEHRVYTFRRDPSEKFYNKFNESFTDIRQLTADQYNVFVNNKDVPIYSDGLLPVVYFNLTAKVIDVETGNIVGIVDLYDFPYNFSGGNATVGVTLGHKKGITKVQSIDAQDIRFETNRLVPKLLEAFNRQ